MQSARKLFTQKGYAATKTREIAQDAGINLALLNYYFRSKEKLFQLVMAEKLGQFMEIIGQIVNNQDSSLHQKLNAMATNYITLLSKEPDLPLFVINTIHGNPDQFFKVLDKRIGIQQSVLMQQLKSEIPHHTHPLHILLNLLSMILFPFLSKPLVMKIGKLKNAEFEKLMEERKKLIPKWIQLSLA